VECQTLKNWGTIVIDTAIILAAGRGSRMNSLTANKPKCQLELAGHTLLDWQISALQHAGLRQQYVVLGYLAETIQGEFHRLINTNWAETNMVRTLLCAENIISTKACIISYSDIAYHPSHITKLCANPEEIAITYDTRWQELWSLRFQDPLSDAESFKESNGILTDIGKKTDKFEHVQGQYMGLIKCTPKGLRWIQNFISELPDRDADKLDMTSMLAGLLKKGKRIGATPVEGKWVEADNAGDLRAYEELLAVGTFSHDFRW